MAVLHYSEPAILDLDGIFDRIAQEAGLAVASRFLGELRETCELLSEMPQIGRARNDLRRGVRSFVHRRGYVVLYQEIEGGVLIERVAAPGRDVEGMFGR